MSEEQKPLVEDIEFKPVTQEVTDLIEKALGDIRGRSFSGRNPELGKMIKCQVCSRRHRAPLDKDGNPQTTCEQRFVVKHYLQEFNEETQTWGEEVPVLAQTSQKTRNGVIGTKPFKGKRINPHPSKIKLLFVEKTRKAFEYLRFDLDGPKEEVQANLHKARQLAAMWIRIERKLDTKDRNHMQQTSRRINRGLATPGSR